MSDLQRTNLHGAVGRLIAMLAACVAAGSVSAAPVPYTFVTTGGSFGTGPSFDPSAVVSGSFSYDPAIPPGTINSFGATVYAGSFLNLSGAVEGRSFSAPVGFSLVGDEIIPPGFAAPVDYLQLLADSLLGGPRDLSGFTIGSLELVNVRLFWTETVLGAPDFLVDSSLPGVLPSFAGRLALDFAPVGTTTPLSFTFFDGLTVRPASVSEPGALLLIGIALAGVALARRRDATDPDRIGG